MTNLTTGLQSNEFNQIRDTLTSIANYLSETIESKNIHLTDVVNRLTNAGLMLEMTTQKVSKILKTNLEMDDLINLV